MPLRSQTSHRSLISLGAGVVLCSAVLSGCTNIVPDIETADKADDPDCAEAMVAMPENVAGFERAKTDSQSTAAWGDPASVIFRCGVAEPGPTTEHCVNANGVDWITEEDGDNWKITTYGRSPAMEVYFEGSQAASSSVMVDLSESVKRVPADKECTTADDAETVEPIPEAENN